MQHPLFSRIEDGRSGKHSTALLVPAGDKEMLRSFVKILKKQTFKDFDILFIYPQGAEFYSDKSLSIISAEEKIPLGTSGCFFAGQSLLYQEGYEIIVVADLDAIPSSPELLSVLVKDALEHKCVSIPLSKAPDKELSADYYTINQYGAFHRSVFEKAGFATPYFWRGAEDWDLTERMKRLGLVRVVREVRVIHPFSGYTVFHKMENRSKFYPYLSSLMKSYLLLGGIGNLFRYFAWYSFYRFFSIVFSDAELKQTLSSSASFVIPEKIPPGPVSTKKTGDSAEIKRGYASRLLDSLAALLGLAFKGEAQLHNELVSVQPSFRPRLLPNMLLAFLLSALYPLEAFLLLLRWPAERRKVLYPIYPKDAGEAAQIYSVLLGKGRL